MAKARKTHGRRQMRVNKQENQQNERKHNPTVIIHHISLANQCSHIMSTQPVSSDFSRKTVPPFYR